MAGFIGNTSRHLSESLFYGAGGAADADRLAPFGSTDSLAIKPAGRAGGHEHVLLGDSMRISKPLHHQRCSSEISDLARRARRSGHEDELPHERVARAVGGE